MNTGSTPDQYVSEQSGYIPRTELGSDTGVSMSESDTAISDRDLWKGHLSDDERSSVPLSDTQGGHISHFPISSLGPARPGRQKARRIVRRIDERSFTVRLPQEGARVVLCSSYDDFADVSALVSACAEIRDVSPASISLTLPDGTLLTQELFATCPAELTLYCT